MDLSDLMADLEAAKAKLAAHRLREDAIRREIEATEARERWDAHRAIADAALIAVCDSPTGATAYDVLQRACRNCRDPERRYLRARALVETIHERGRAQLASVFGTDAFGDSDWPEPLLNMSLEEEAELLCALADIREPPEGSPTLQSSAILPPLQVHARRSGGGDLEAGA